MSHSFWSAPRELVGAFHLAYLPLFLGYFAHSFSGVRGMGLGLTTVPTSFWVQESLAITPAQLEFAFFTIAMPWIAKLLFGHIVDWFTVEARKRIIFIAGALMMTGFGMLAWLAHAPGSDAPLQLAMFIIGFLFVSFSIMFQDVILDPMGRHIVARTGSDGRELSDEAFRRKVGLVQTWCRISFNVASILGMATALMLTMLGVSMVGIFLTAMIVPIATMVIVQFIRLPREVETTVISGRIVAFALAALGVSIWAQISEVSFAREASFVVTLGVIIALMRILWQRDTTSAPEAKRGLLFTMFALFFMRFAPMFGEGVNWWHREVLGFDRQFEMWLGMFGGALALAFMLFLYRFALRGHLGWVLIGLNAVVVAFSFRDIGYWYGVHEWIGGVLGIDSLFAVRLIAWFDTAGASPFIYVYSLITFVLLAQYADEVGTATWFTVFAMFLNLGINATNLATSYLNRVFEVTRGEYENGTLIAAGDFSDVGAILWTSLSLQFIVPTLAVLFLLTPWRPASEPYAYALWRTVRNRIRVS